MSKKNSFMNKENILIFNDSDGEFGGDVKNTKLQIERQNGKIHS